jgi:hypothetical protein
VTPHCSYRLVDCCLRLEGIKGVFWVGVIIVSPLQHRSNTVLGLGTVKIGHQQFCSDTLTATAE